MNNRNKQKKKNPLGLIIVIVMLLSSFASSDAFLDFTRRLRRMIQTGHVGPGVAASLPRIALIVLAAVVIAAAIAIAARTAKRESKVFDGLKARGGGTAAHHSHDRLQGYTGDEKSAEHWKKQLDGFLAAGIIDRSEYRVLLERRRR